MQIRVIMPPHTMRGPGYFGIDLGLAKSWNVSESQSVKFSWETFNVTNTTRFDVRSKRRESEFHQQLYLWELHIDSNLAACHAVWLALHFVRNNQTRETVFSGAARMH